MEGCFNGAFLLVSALFSATFRRASEAGQLKRAVIVFVIVTALGMFAADSYLVLRGKGFGISWREITCLNHGAGALKIAGLGSDVIKLDFGHGVRIWEGQPYLTFLGTPMCFHGSPTDADARNTESCAPEFWMPTPPGPIREQAVTLIDERIPGLESRKVCIGVAILADESIWYWRSVQYDGMTLLIFSIMYGGFLGSLAGFAMVWLVCRLSP